VIKIGSTRGSRNSLAYPAVNAPSTSWCPSDAAGSEEAMTGVDSANGPLQSLATKCFDSAVFRLRAKAQLYVLESSTPKAALLFRLRRAIMQFMFRRPCPSRFSACPPARLPAGSPLPPHPRI
jgi:hypothetical protein